MKYYMHTLDGKPAFYEAGCQICFAQQSQLAKGFNILKATTLAQIRKEQRASKRFRKSYGWDVSTYGYVIVYTSEKS